MKNNIEKCLRNCEVYNSSNSIDMTDHHTITAGI